MSEQRCWCAHPFGLHRVNREIGNRNECWALNDNQLIAKWCQCRQFRPHADEQAREAEGREG